MRREGQRIVEAIINSFCEDLSDEKTEARFQMFQIETYIEALLKRLKDDFGERLVYMGLQGSYLRNEQTENSDIDIMAVIDRMTVSDLKVYKEAILRVGYYEKSCGFICGKDELAAWNPLEACHLIHTTRDIYGTLPELLPKYTLEDEKNFIKLSIGNLFHELCHRYLHADREKNESHLPGTYKSLFFIMQNLVYLEQGAFYATKEELSEHLEGLNKEVFAMMRKLQSGRAFDFDEAFSLLFSWCQETLGKWNQ